MTNEEIDRAIAEHLGWSGIRMSNVWEITDPPEDGVVLCGQRPDGRLRAVPRYSTDLNAMHEAEKTLVDHWDGFHFRNHLCNNIHATASQRAEAFLKTIGKWRGE